jgi:hypothetical protein
MIGELGAENKGEMSENIRVRFEVFTTATMKNAVFWDINTRFLPHRKHYFFATEPSRLMLCKICGFHVGGYEECRLLGSYIV